MKRNGIILFFILCTNIVAGQEVLTLGKALEIAFAHSPTLVQSKISLEQNRLNLKAEKAALKSQFSLNVTPFNYSRSNVYDEYNSVWYTSENKRASGSLGITQPIKWTDGSIALVNDVSWQDATNRNSSRSNTSFKHNLSLQLSQPLFTYNRTKIKLQELELSLETSLLNYATQQLSIERSVTTNFYNIYQLQKELSIAKDEYTNQQQNYEIIRNKTEAGLIRREELYQAKVNLATAESSVYSREVSYRNARDRFKLQIGLPLETEIMVLPDTEIVTPEIDTQEAVQHGLAQRMELRRKAITLERDAFSLIRARADNEFKGNLTARIGMEALGDKTSNMYDKPTDNEQVGVTLTIPIFDWGAKKARVKSTELTSESDRIDLEEEKKAIILDIREICYNLPVLLRQINIKKDNVENAEQTYNIQLEKYRNGNLSGMELQQYQSQLSQARQSYTNSIISYKRELLNLKIQTLWDFEKKETYLKIEPF